MSVFAKAPLAPKNSDCRSAMEPRCHRCRTRPRTCGRSICRQHLALTLRSRRSRSRLGRRDFSSHAPMKPAKQSSLPTHSSTLTHVGEGGDVEGLSHIHFPSWHWLTVCPVQMSAGTLSATTSGSANLGTTGERRHIQDLRQPPGARPAFGDVRTRVSEPPQQAPFPGKAQPRHHHNNNNKESPQQISYLFSGGYLSTAVPLSAKERN